MTLSPEPEDSLLDKFKEIDISVQSLNLPRFKSLYKASYLIKNFIDDAQPNIIHTQGIRADGLVVKYISKYNHIATIRNYPYDDYPMKYGKLLGKYMAYKHIKYIKLIKHSIACSETIAKTIRQNHGINIRVIQNGVDTNKYKLTSKEVKKELRNKLGIPQDKKVFISVGSLIIRKDPATVIKSFFKTNYVKERSILYIIGDGPLRRECETILNGDSRVIFTGQVNNVADYLKASDYFVSASLSEGLPNTVLEALATGLPVCLSDIGSHQEILNIDQKAGILVPVRDVEKFASALDRLMMKDYDEMRLAARNIIDNHLNAEVMSYKYQRLYEEIMRGQ